MELNIVNLGFKMVSSVVIKNLLGKDLNGDFYDAKSSKVIVLCHGFMSEKTAHGKFVKFAEKLVELGFSVYSFNLSGYGESEDEKVSISSGILDLRCILSYVRFQKFEKIGVLGHSLGGIIALHQSLEKIDSLCLLAPVTNGKSYSMSERYEENEISEVKKNGFMRITEGIRNRDYFDVSEKFFEERGSVNQEEVMSNVCVPTYIIHGSSDDLIPVSDSISAFKYLSDDCRLEVIDGENHSLNNNLNRTNKFVCDWFVSTL